MDKKSLDQFSSEETRKRMEAALRGARIAGHKPMESLTRKRRKRQRPKAKKTR